MHKIDSFKGKYFFLSNFYPAPVTYLGITYQNNEAAFQAQKTADINIKKIFSNLSAIDAKRRGKKVHLIEGWDLIKFDIMYEICKAKFDQNKDLFLNLMQTEGYYLEEGNNWGDKIWGTVDEVGENHLGIILMKLRDEYRLEILEANYYESF